MKKDTLINAAELKKLNGIFVVSVALLTDTQMEQNGMDFQIFGLMKRISC